MFNILVLTVCLKNVNTVFQLFPLFTRYPLICRVTFICSELAPFYTYMTPRHVLSTFCFLHPSNMLYRWNRCIAYYWRYLDVVLIEDYIWKWVKLTELTVFLTPFHVVRPVTRMGILVVQQSADTQLLRGRAVPTRPITRARRFVTKDAVQPVAVFCWYRSICGTDE